MEFQDPMNATQDKALVLLSGGQDSTTCLYWAIDRFERDAVSSIAFDYGQRHRIELECAQRIAAEAGVEHDCLPIDTFTALGGDALTDTTIDVDKQASSAGTLPNTFVAGRNLIFLTYAAAYAYQRGIDHLVTGVAQTDYSGYPDCRQATIESLQHTLRLGMESHVQIHTPLMRRSKKETVELARDLGALDAMGLTHSCYKGKRPPCGECSACRLRAKGFAEAGMLDPLLANT
jgi:7-cyano-7-deazaguanine synthase